MGYIQEKKESFSTSLSNNALFSPIETWYGSTSHFILLWYTCILPFLTYDLVHIPFFLPTQRLYTGVYKQKCRMLPMRLHPSEHNFIKLELTFDNGHCMDPAHEQHATTKPSSPNDHDI